MARMVVCHNVQYDRVTGKKILDERWYWACPRYQVYDETMVCNSDDGCSDLSHGDVHDHDAYPIEAPA